MSRGGTGGEEERGDEREGQGWSLGGGNGGGRVGADGRKLEREEGKTTGICLNIGNKFIRRLASSINTNNQYSIKHFTVT